MTWLVLRIFGYLLVAGLIGVIAGWLLAKVTRRERWESGVHQARAEPFDLRNQLERQAGQIEALRERLALQAQEQAPRNEEVLSSSDLQESTAAFEEGLIEMRTQLMASGDLIRALHQEIVRLRSSAEETAAAQAPSATLELTVKDLEGRLVRKMAELDRLQRALTSEEKKVRDLERERELQNKSLLVLNQQLEMERKPQRAAR